MDARARFRAGLFVGLVASFTPAVSAAAAQAPPSAPAGEFYVADVSAAPRDSGLRSSIELKPDCSFDWRFSTPQMALSAHGNWRRDNMLHLENPDQVGEPAAELASSSRDPAVGLRASLETATARMAFALELELEFPDGSYVRLPLADGDVMIPAGEEMPSAVRLYSPLFTWRSQPVAVPPGSDNVLTLRMVPADFGQAYFASQQTGFDDRGMTIDWRGIAIRYDRAALPTAGAAR